MLRHCKWELYGLTLVLSAAVLIAPAPRAQADGLLANWMLNENGGSAGPTFADSSGNGNTATLMGTDTLTTMQGPFGASGPTALYFNGVSGNVENTATNNSGGAVSNINPTYLNVPYNPALSISHYSGSTPVGYNALTLSAWIFLPSNWTYSGTSASPGSEMISYSAAYQSGYPGEVYQFGDGYQAGNLRKMAFMGNAGGPSPYAAVDQSYSTNNTKGHWQLITAVYYGGNSNSAVGIYDIYENGVLKVANQGLPGGGNAAIPLLTANANEPLVIGNGYGVKDNEWYGGLSDLGIWGVQLTGDPTVGPGVPGTVGNSGGEILAMYNAPTGGIAAVQQYGVNAMNSLFTLYDEQLATTAAVTTGNGTLTWKYVSSGLTGGSGVVGQFGNGQYYMQFDGNGGGVETVATPEPGTLALVASGLAGLLAYGWRKRK